MAIPIPDNCDYKWYLGYCLMGISYDNNTYTDKGALQDGIIQLQMQSNGYWNNFGSYGGFRTTKFQSNNYNTSFTISSFDNYSANGDANKYFSQIPLTIWQKAPIESHVNDLIFLRKAEQSMFGGYPNDAGLFYIGDNIVGDPLQVKRGNKVVTPNLKPWTIYKSILPNAEGYLRAETELRFFQHSLNGVSNLRIMRTTSHPGCYYDSYMGNISSANAAKIKLFFPGGFYSRDLWIYIVAQDYNEMANSSSCKQPALIQIWNDNATISVRPTYISEAFTTFGGLNKMRVYAFKIWFDSYSPIVRRIQFGPNNIIKEPYDGQYISCIAIQLGNSSDKYWWPKTYEEFEESIDKWKLKDYYLGNNDYCRVSFEEASGLVKDEE